MQVSFKRIKNKGVKMFYKYQKAMWYIGQAGSELGKPLRFIAELGVILLLMSDSGYKTSLSVKLIVYVALMLWALSFGKWLTKIGVVQYNTDLANKQNNAVTEILNTVRRLEQWRKSCQNSKKKD